MKKIIALFLSIAALFSGCDDDRKIVIEPNAVILDVRSKAEFDTGHIGGALLIPHTEIEDKVGALIPDKTTPVYLYCRSGRRSQAALEKMRRMGYKKLHNLGGFNDAAKALGK